MAKVFNSKNHLKFSGTDWSSDEPEELQDMFGQRPVGDEESGVDPDSGWTRDEYRTPVGDYESETDNNDSGGNDNFEDTSITSDFDDSWLDENDNIDLEEHTEPCRTCGGYSRYNNPETPPAYMDHCNPDCDCNLDEESHNFPHCPTCKDKKCKGKEPYHWYLENADTGEKITDVCPDCGNVGVVELGHYDAEDWSAQQGIDLGGSSTENSENQQLVNNVPKTIKDTDNAPAVIINSTPTINGFEEDETNQGAPTVKKPVVLQRKPKKKPVANPTQPVQDQTPGVSFDEAIKVNQMIKNLNGRSEGTEPTETHYNCGCEKRNGFLSDQDFVKVMQSKEYREGIKNIRMGNPTLTGNGQISQSTANRQEAMGDFIFNMKRCKGDKFIENLRNGSTGDQQ